MQTSLVRRAGGAAAVLAATLLALPAAAAVVVDGHHDNDPGTGYVAMANTIVQPTATFDGNGFNGFFGADVSALIRGGSFSGNANVGAQFILRPGSGTAIVVEGGTFDRNHGNADGSGGVGLDVQGGGGLVLVQGGSYSDNLAYGLSTFSTTLVQAGRYAGNDSIGIVSFGNTTTVLGGSFADNRADFGAVNGTIRLVGDFASAGVFTGAGTVVGTLLLGSAAQTFSYATFGSGTIELVDAAMWSATVSAVPEPSAALLLAIGFGALALTRRTANRSSQRLA